MSDKTTRIPVTIRLDSKVLSEAVVRYSLNRAARGPSSLVGGSLIGPPTRDQATEEVGRLRVGYAGLTGILVSYDFGEDTCRVSIDSPGVYLDAPRTALRCL